MRSKLASAIISFVAVTGVAGCGGSSPPNQAKLTWVGVADWVFDVGDLRIYMDGALTRFDPANFSGGGSGLSNSRTAVCPNTATDQKVIDALGKKPSLFMTGHSNLDHSYDTATLAKLSGSPRIIGSQSTCFQTIAQGIPASQCTSVKGGESMDLGNGVHVRVVRWNHSGNQTTIDLHAPLELTKPPTPDANGCFRPGVVEDFPNGGGGRGYLFTAGDSGHRFSWYFIDTGSDFDFEQPVVDNVGTFPSPKDGITAALQAEGLTTVDLWIGLNSLPFSQKLVPILHPKAFIPNHLGSFFIDFFQGLTTPYTDTSVPAYMQSQSVKMVVPTQYMDAWILDATGVVSTPNTEVKSKLGF